MISTLIDKQDTFEIVRDKIAEILVAEVASQMALATTAGKDPELWNFEVYTERSDAWEKFLNQDTDETPIVNIWWDNSSFNESGSNVMERQATDGFFNIDVVARGVSEEDGTGHKPGDREAAFNMQRIVRLVRNILMAAPYTYLGLRGTVGQRWPQSIESFQPSIGQNPVQNVQGARIKMRVKFNEFSPQVEAQILESIGVEVKREIDGKIVLEAEYDYS